jgi:hypothetical protein
MKNIFTLFLMPIATVAGIAGLIHLMKLDSFVFAWALNFLLMFFVSINIELHKSPLTSSYFDAKPWEKKGKIYEHVGIDFFRKILVLIGWEKLNKKNNPIEKNTQALNHFLHQTKKSELGHLLIFIIVMGMTVFVAITMGAKSALWLLLLNVVLNLYPVLLQRYNRPRLVRAIAFSQRK